MNEVTNRNLRQNQQIGVPSTGKNRVWNTVLVEDLKRKIENGDSIQSNTPFYEGDIELKSAEIVFEYSEEELIELAKCANDIVYFANNYCVSMTDEGIRRIRLRPYQEDLLRHYQNNRWSVVLASRQIGKCFSPQTIVKLKRLNSDDTFDICLFQLFHYLSGNKISLMNVLYKIEAFLLGSKIYSKKQLKGLIWVNGNAQYAEQSSKAQEEEFCVPVRRAKVNFLKDVLVKSLKRIQKFLLLRK